LLAGEGAKDETGKWTNRRLVCFAAAMSVLSHLFANNRAWAAKIEAQEPGFFANLAKQQSPQYLWIGCSDSRVPSNQLIGLLPGEVFVHRNIANVVVHTDLNCLSVVEFAVNVLKVKDVILCGHYGCSGVRAAMEDARVGLATNWLRNIQDVHSKYQDFLGGFPDADRPDRFCELNAIEQVVNLCQTTIVRDAWEKGQELTVHGWIYGVGDGLMRDLHMTVSDPGSLSSVQASALEGVRARSGILRPPIPRQTPA
jgi:carbonic anhydrase